MSPYGAKGIRTPNQLRAPQFAATIRATTVSDNSIMTRLRLQMTLAEIRKIRKFGNVSPRLT